MEEYPLAAKVRKDLYRIIRDAERCRDIIKELLEFARQTQQNILPLDLNKALLRTIFLLEYQPLFQNITIIKELSPDLPNAPVDRRQINHVFMNVILNAAEAMEEAGTLTVKSYLSPDKKYVCLEISDSGPGIPEDVINHIFEPFFTTKEEGKGTGLGLSVVYGIVNNHHGKIWAESKFGDGATFFIEFPLSNENGGKEEHEHH